MAHRRQIEETLDTLSDLEGTDLPPVPPVLVLRSPLNGGAGVEVATSSASPGVKSGLTITHPQL